MKMWPEAITILLWPFTLKYASDKHNPLPLDSLGYTPLDRFTRIRQQIHPEIFHTWGCLAFVLDARQQSGAGSVPKWEPRGQKTVNLGFSPVHLSDVALVFNPTTCYVSLLYQLVFNDDFLTLEYVQNQVHPPHWSILVKNLSQLATDENFMMQPDS